MRALQAFGFFLLWASLSATALPAGSDSCSVSSTGTITGGDTTVTLTITVTGPCDARLAQKMREAIARVRSQFK